MLSNRWFRLSVLPLMLFVALFPVLALDVTARLIARAGHQDMGNLVLLLFYELSRALRTILGLLVAAVLLVRGAQRPDARALVLFILFAVLSYAMAFGGTGYVGPFQEALVGGLERARVSRDVMFLAFGYPHWAAWLALAALVRFSVLFPQPLQARAIEASGAADRTGLLRGVPGAGLDVGAGARRFVDQALEGGWLEAGPVWTAGIAGAVASIALRATTVRLVLWLPFFAGIGIVITALRAGYTIGGETERRRLRWLAYGSLTGIAMFGAAGLVGLLGESNTVALTVFVLMTLAPGAVLLGIVVAVIGRDRENVRTRAAT